MIEMHNVGAAALDSARLTPTAGEENLRVIKKWCIRHISPRCCKCPDADPYPNGKQPVLPCPCYLLICLTFAGAVAGLVSLGLFVLFDFTPEPRSSTESASVANINLIEQACYVCTSWMYVRYHPPACLDYATRCYSVTAVFDRTDCAHDQCTQLWDFGAEQTKASKQIKELPVGSDLLVVVESKQPCQEQTNSSGAITPCHQWVLTTPPYIEWLYVLLGVIAACLLVCCCWLGWWTWWIFLDRSH